MELRSVNYGWAIWWSIYFCGRPAACSAACCPDVKRFITSHRTSHRTSHESHLPGVSPDTCLALACGSPLTMSFGGIEWPEVRLLYSVSSKYKASRLSAMGEWVFCW